MVTWEVDNEHLGTSTMLPGHVTTLYSMQESQTRGQKEVKTIIIIITSTSLHLQVPRDKLITLSIELNRVGWSFYLAVPVVGRKFNTLRSLHIQRSIDILFRLLQFLFRDVNANTKNKLQIKLEITSIKSTINWLQMILLTSLSPLLFPLTRWC